MKQVLFTILVIFYLNCGGGSEPTSNPFAGSDGPIVRIENLGGTNFRIIFGNFNLTNIISFDIKYDATVFSVNEIEIVDNPFDFGNPIATFSPGTISMVFNSLSGVEGNGTILEFSLTEVGSMEQTAIYLTNVSFKNSIGNDIYGSCSIITQTTARACADANGIWAYDDAPIQFFPVCYINGFQSSEGWNDFGGFLWSNSFCIF